MVQASNEWEEQYACVDSPELIREQITLKPEPLQKLNLIALETAINTFEEVLSSSYIPTSGDIKFIQKLIGVARAYARVHYADHKIFHQNVHSNDLKGRPATPIMLTGQSGVGKSAVVAALSRLFRSEKYVKHENFFGCWTLEPSRIIKIEGTQSLAGIYRMFLDEEQIVEEKSKVQTPRMQQLASRRLYSSGCCIIGFDEFQFVSLSASANTLVTKMLLGLTYLQVPQFFVGNFSLLHRLRGRNTEEKQRLLTNVTVLNPDLPNSSGWTAHLTEYQRVAESVLDFQLNEEGQTLWNLTAGLKRNLLHLLTNAYRIARENDRNKMKFSDVRDAYSSQTFSHQRVDIELLVRQAIEGRPARKDLWCPLENSSPSGEQYREALRTARATAVSKASTVAALTVDERKTIQQLERTEGPGVTRPGIVTVNKKAVKGKKSADSLIQAAHMFSSSKKTSV